jgi:hypothetical protein
MCYKNGVKVFYVIFKASFTQPTNHVYKSLEVFKTLPSLNEVANVIEKNKIEDLRTVQLIKVEIPYSKLL